MLKTGLLGLSATLMLLCSVARSAPPSLWCIDDMAKIDPTTGKAHEDNPRILPNGLSGDYQAKNTVWDGHTIKLLAAKNEVVAFQIVLEGPATHVTIEASSLAGAGTIPAKNMTLFREWYLKVDQSTASDTIGDGWYPDALIPLELGAEKYGGPLDIPDPRNHIDGQKNQAVWVDLYVPADSAAGIYKGALRVASAEGTQTLPLELEVLNFALPDTFHQTVDLNTYGKTETMDPALRLKYYQLLQQHRCYLSVDSHRIEPTLDASTGKIDWTSYDAANAALLDGTAFTDKAGYGPGPMQGTPMVFWELPFAANVPRLAKNHYRGEAWPMDFKQAHTPAYDKLYKDTLAAFVAHFKEKGWTKTTYIVFQNGLDEPTSYKEYLEMKYLAGLTAEVNSPLIKYKADIGHFADCTHRVKEFKSLQEMLDLLEPVNFWTAAGGVGNAGPLFSVDALAKRMARGDLVFYYGSNEPPEICGSLVDSESVGAPLRALIAARYNLTGAEQWECTLHYDLAWEGKPNVTAAKERLYGSAQFIYPEKGLGVDFGGPVASIRLKGFRRGQQDAEYFWLARQRHPAEADSLLEKLIPEALDKAASLPRTSRGTWSHNPADYEAARATLGHLLSQN